jgi:dolichol-phosphate mannosyltransferase
MHQRITIVTEDGDAQEKETRHLSEITSIAETAPAEQGATDETDTSVSVVIPTLNESENIKNIVDKCLHALEDYTTEIIIVDDDSSDLTWQVAAREYETDARVRVLWRIAEPDLATAVLTGLQAASNEYCVVIDADLQHPPEKLTELIDPLMTGADITIGSRYTDGGNIESWSLVRKVISLGATITAQVCVPEARSISDPMSGFFAVRRQIVAEATLHPEGYKILLEILANCAYETVVEVPFVFRERERGNSKLTLAEYPTFMKHTLTLGLHRLRSLVTDNTSAGDTSGLSVLTTEQRDADTTSVSSVSSSQNLEPSQHDD